MLWPFAINENKKLFTVKCESLSTGAAEGVWQTQGHRAVHQPVQRWVHADGLRGVPRATGQTERHEQPLGQTGQLAGGVEVFTTGGSHAVSSRCQSMYGCFIELELRTHSWISTFLLHVWPTGLPWDEPRSAALVGKHRPQEERGGSHWPHPGQWHSPRAS